MTATVCLSDSIRLCGMMDDPVFRRLQAFALDALLAWHLLCSLQGWLLPGQMISHLLPFLALHPDFTLSIAFITVKTTLSVGLVVCLCSLGGSPLESRERSASLVSAESRGPLCAWHTYDKTNGWILEIRKQMSKRERPGVSMKLYPCGPYTK